VLKVPIAGAYFPKSFHYLFKHYVWSLGNLIWNFLNKFVGLRVPSNCTVLALGLVDFLPQVTEKMVDHTAAFVFAVDMRIDWWRPLDLAWC
jgi:hypothetical protein